MAYTLEPVNRPYDPVEPMPTPLGFVHVESGETFLKVDGYNPMPDFFSLESMFSPFFASDRFRDVLEKISPGDVKFTEFTLHTPPHMARAERYFRIEVLGRRQQLDWERSPKAGPGPGSNTVGLAGGAARPKWIMREPLDEPPHIWIEIEWHHNGLIYQAYIPELKDTYPPDIFVSNRLAKALHSSLPGQVHLRPVSTP